MCRAFNIFPHFSLKSILVKNFYHKSNRVYIFVYTHIISLTIFKRSRDILFGNSRKMCIRDRRDTNYQFCEVCRLQGFKRMSQLVKDVDLYVATP